LKVLLTMGRVVAKRLGHAQPPMKVKNRAERHGGERDLHSRSIQYLRRDFGCVQSIQQGCTHVSPIDSLIRRKIRYLPNTSHRDCQFRDAKMQQPSARARALWAAQAIE
jgi:hypothetical protein